MLMKYPNYDDLRLGCAKEEEMFSCEGTQKAFGNIACASNMRCAALKAVHLGVYLRQIPIGLLCSPCFKCI